MKYKIVNKKKFRKCVIFSSLIFLLLILSSFIITSSTFSHNAINYKKICVVEGETLWSIADNEKHYNDYYSKKDIREIIYNIKKVNHITNGNLYIGQELEIPTI